MTPDQAEELAAANDHYLTARMNMLLKVLSRRLDHRECVELSINQWAKEAGTDRRHALRCLTDLVAWGLLQRYGPGRNQTSLWGWHPALMCDMKPRQGRAFLPDPQLNTVLTPDKTQNLINWEAPPVIEPPDPWQHVDDPCPIASDPVPSPAGNDHGASAAPAVPVPGLTAGQAEEVRAAKAAGWTVCLDDDGTLRFYEPDPVPAPRAADRMKRQPEDTLRVFVPPTPDELEAVREGVGFALQRKIETPLPAADTWPIQGAAIAARTCAEQTGERFCDVLRRLVLALRDTAYQPSGWGAVPTLAFDWLLGVSATDTERKLAQWRQRVRPLQHRHGPPGKGPQSPRKGSWR